MFIVKSENHTYICDDLSELKQALGVTDDEAYNEWEIHEMSYLELGRQVGGDFRPLRLDSEKVTAGKVVGLDVQYLGYSG